jgi:hypothetical protein
MMPSQLNSMMMKKIFLQVLCFLTLLALAGCDNQEESVPDISGIPEVEMPIVRLDRELFRAKTHEEIVEILDKYPDFSEKYLQRSNYPHDSLLTGLILKFNTEPSTDTLLADVEKIFGEMETIQKTFEEAFRFGRYYFPDLQTPKIYTVVSGFTSFGFGKDIYVSDDLVVVGLDFFAGSEATYRPADFPAYILRRYAPEYIVPTTLTFLSAKYNAYDNKDKTLLADMIFYGKSYEFVNKLMPYVSDTLIIGYTGEEWGISVQFQEKIWARSVENNIFFDTSNDAKNRYLEERPNVIEIADICPGRIGRWVGWEIVKKYLRDRPELSFRDFMQDSNAQKIFQESRYKPKAP